MTTDELFGVHLAKIYSILLNGSWVHVKDLRIHKPSRDIGDWTFTATDAGVADFGPEPTHYAVAGLMQSITGVRYSSRDSVPLDVRINGDTYKKV